MSFGTGQSLSAADCRRRDSVATHNRCPNSGTVTGRTGRRVIDSLGQICVHQELSRQHEPPSHRTPWTTTPRGGAPHGGAARFHTFSKQTFTLTRCDRLTALTNKTMGTCSMLVNSRTADVLRTTGPTSETPSEIVNTLNEATPERLRDVATYAEEVAEHREREARLEAEPARPTSRNDPMTSQTRSRRRPRSQSRKSTTIATTGSGVRANKSSRNIRDQSTQTNELDSGDSFCPLIGRTGTIPLPSSRRYAPLLGGSSHRLRQGRKFPENRVFPKENRNTARELTDRIGLIKSFPETSQSRF